MYPSTSSQRLWLAAANPQTGRPRVRRLRVGIRVAALLDITRVGGLVWEADGERVTAQDASLKDPLLATWHQALVDGLGTSESASSVHAASVIGAEVARQVETSLVAATVATERKRLLRSSVVSAQLAAASREEQQLLGIVHGSRPDDPVSLDILSLIWAFPSGEWQGRWSEPDTVKALERVVGEREQSRWAGAVIDALAGASGPVETSGGFDLLPGR